MKDVCSMYSNYTNTRIPHKLKGVFGIPNECAIIFMGESDYYIKFVDEESGIYEVVHPIVYKPDGSFDEFIYTRKVLTDFRCIEDVWEFIRHTFQYEEFKEFIHSYVRLTMKYGRGGYSSLRVGTLEDAEGQLPF